MAPFNPELGPVQPREYGREFSPTSGGIADKSSGLRLAAIGEGIGDLVSIADKFVKNKAEIETREGFESLRDEHIANLQAVTQPQQVIPQPVQSNSVGGKVATETGNLMEANASMDVPPNLERGMARIATLNQAAENKANDTPYTAAQNALLKYYRSQYPNYRPYIDQTASSVTGKDPANAYAENMMQDLNRMQQSTKSEVDKTLTAIRAYAGYQTVDKTTMSQMYEFVRANGISAIGRANQWIDEVAATEANAKQKSALVTAKDQDFASQKGRAETAAVSVYSDIVNNGFYANAARGDLLSPSKLAEKIQEGQLYPGRYSATEMDQAGRVITAQRGIFESKLLAESTKPLIDKTTGKPALDVYGNVMTYASLNGPEKTQLQINQALKPFDIASRAALDDKTGTATYAATHAQRYKEDVANGFVTDPTNIAMVKLGIINREAGPQVANKVYEEYLTSDGDRKTMNWLADKGNNMRIGVNPEVGITKQPTFKADVEEARDGTTTGKPLAPETKVYDKLAERINELANPETPDIHKMRIAKYYFSPEGRDVLGNFKQGYRDAKGNWVNGREAVWNTLTSEAVTKEIARLSTMPGGGIIAKNYKDWMEQEFAQHMFQPELASLNQPATYTTPELSKTGRVINVAESVKIAYISDANGQRFEMRDAKNRPIDVDYTGGAVKVPRNVGEAAALRQYDTSIKRLNEGIKNMTQMEKSLGGNIDNYIWDTLVNKLKVYSPNDPDMIGLPAKMAEAVRNSNKPARKIEDALKMQDRTK